MSKQQSATVETGEHKPDSAPLGGSAARLRVGTVRELRDFLQPFTDECPVTFEDGRPAYIAYKCDADCNGKIFVGVVRQNDGAKDAPMKTSANQKRSRKTEDARKRRLQHMVSQPLSKMEITELLEHATALEIDARKTENSMASEIFADRTRNHKRLAAMIRRLANESSSATTGDSDAGRKRKP